jgi:hypothetical protein
MDDIKAAVTRAGTYMVLEEDGPDLLQWGTRDHGSTYDETPGQADIIEARRVRQAILEAGGTARIDIIDEWVTVTVRP